MQTSEFNKPVTAAQLNESMFKKFGQRVNFEKYTREELEDYRNLLRTQLHQAESNQNFNDLLTNETYQKNKFVMSVLNTKIKEMLGEGAKVDRMVKHIEKSERKAGKSKKDAENIAWATANKRGMLNNKNKKAEEGIEEKTMKKTNEAKKAKPDFLDMDKDGNKKEPMKKAIKDKKVGESTGKFDKTDTTWTDKSGKKHPAQRVTRKTDQLSQGEEDKPRTATSMKSKKTGKAMSESTIIFRNHVAIVNESLRALLREDEEGKAKAITAASDMVNDYTTWMQRVGQYQTKSMIELADAIRAEFGPQESETFKQAVAPALAATIETLTAQREAISHAVAVLAGEATDIAPMGQEPGMSDVGGEEIPPAGDDEMNAGGDEFEASDAAAGGMETAGRAVRESKEVVRARKLQEAHFLMRTLAK
jgi:hypothetical protein